MEDCALSPGITVEKGRVSALDSVRAVAILAVIGTHSLSATVAVTQSYSIPKTIFSVFDYGQFGVQVFFALSGWLIFSLYYKKDKQPSAAHYWSRRISRIWPLWALFVVIYFVLYNIDTEGLPTWAAMVLALTFLGWTVGSLVVVPIGGLTIMQEMGHYLAFWFLRKRGIEAFLISVVVGYITFYLAKGIAGIQSVPGVVAWAMDAWLRLSLFNSWPFFVLGGLSYLGLQWLKKQPDQQGNSILSPAGAVWLLIALALGSQSVYAQETPGYFVFGYVILAVLLGISLNRIPLVNRVSWSIGRYSYFMYFFHFLVLRQLEPIFINSGLMSENESMVQNLLILFAMFVLATAISWAVALLSWKVFESPIMKVARNRFS